MFADIRTEWRVADLESKTNENSRRLYEVDSLRRDVDSLEHSLRQARSDIDGLRYELQAEKERTERLENSLEALLLKLNLDL